MIRPSFFIIIFCLFYILRQQAKLSNLQVGTWIMPLFHWCQSMRFRCFLLEQEPDSKHDQSFCLRVLASIRSCPSQSQHHHQVEASACTQKIHHLLSFQHQHRRDQRGNLAHCSCHTPSCTPMSWHIAHGSPKVAAEHSAGVNSIILWLNVLIKIQMHNKLNK